MAFVSTSCLRGVNSRFEPDVRRVLNVYDKLGINQIELGAAHTKPVTKEDILKYKTKDRDFIIHAFFPPDSKKIIINFASTDKKMRDYSLKIAKKAIEWCRIVDAPLYSVHTGMRMDINMNDEPHGKPGKEEDIYNYASESLKTLCETANQYGIKIAIENQIPSNYSFFDSADKFKKLLKMVNKKNLGLLVDIGHLRLAQIKTDEDPKGFFEDMGNKIMELHVHGVVEGEDHKNITEEPSFFKSIPKSVLRKAFLTLEGNWLNEKEIIEGKKFIEEEQKCR